MSRIIELYREPKAGLPHQIVVGAPVADGGAVVDSISFYETGAFGGKAFRGPCFIIAFRDSAVRRVIPASQILDIAWETDDKPKNVQLKAPKGEE
jgi:hypothetical protein